MFAKPHGPEDSESRLEAKSLYSGKKYKTCTAKFAPGYKESDWYFCFVDALQYIFIRNYKRSEIVKRIPLEHFPTCISIVDFTKIKIEDDASMRDGGESISRGNKMPVNKGNHLVSIGTKEGKVLIYRIG